MDFLFYDLRQAFRLQHLEREPFCHTISPGEEPAEGVEDIGEFRKVHLMAESATLKGARYLRRALGVDRGAWSRGRKRSVQ